MAAAGVCAKACWCGGGVAYERRQIALLAASLLDVVARDRQADRVARNAPRTFMGGPPRPKERPSERPVFRIGVLRGIPPARRPRLHRDARIGRIGILAGGRRRINVPAGGVSLLPTLAGHGSALAVALWSLLMVELWRARGSRGRRCAAAFRARRHGRATVVARLVGIALRRPGPDQRDRQKMDSDSQALLLGSIGFTRPPALRRPWAGTLPQPVAPEISFAVPERPRAT